MRFFTLAARWAAVAMISLVGSELCHGQQGEHELKLDLTPLLDLNHAFALTPNALEKDFHKEGFTENPFIRWTSNLTKAGFSVHPFSNINVELSLLERKVLLTSSDVTFAEGKARTVAFATEQADNATVILLSAKLDELLACKAVPGPKPLLGWKETGRSKASLWTSAKGVALLSVNEHMLKLVLAPAQTLPTTLTTGFSLADGGERADTAAFFVRLDQLLAVPRLWSLTQDAFEESFKMTGATFKQSPFYKWNTMAKDSLLLTRHVFSNTSTDLLLFDDAVNAEEALVEFRDGKVGKVTLTLLTRGNSGKAAKEKFDEVFLATGRALGGMFKVQPTKTVAAGKSVAKIQGYLWSTPHTLVLMEFNEEAPKGNVEFLRLKMTPASSRVELLNTNMLSDTVTTKSRASLGRNVKRDMVTGDVYVTGVPMIDQGQKGYCVSASCARIFNYLGVKCDQDEIAELVKNDAERGTRPSDMYSALRKIDQQYNMRVKVVKLPRGYGLMGMRDTEVVRAQKGDLAKLIQENVAIGTPLLWAVALPSEPVAVRTGLSGSPAQGEIKDPQAGGGHMRMIIGYNTKSGEVIFTDSWGAGHEIKRMALRDADAMTQAVFTMQPAQ
ncbi:MAG: hypothetical protein JWO08_2450 [Verrucomicrobiaceae bacterium]|nr:hypothetical protein [Verrucomicrobiaceae bacterium]